jgi:RHS repeat-associated protein
LIRSYGHDPETGNLAHATTVNALDEVVEITDVTRTIETAPVRHQIKVTTDTVLGSTEEQYWLGVGGSLQDPDKLVGKRVFAWNDGNGTSASYRYDELSNQIGNADGDEFVYNAEGNRLASATLAREGVSVEYTYDAAGFATSRDDVPITWTATGRMSSYGPIEIEWDMLDRLLSLSVGGVTRDFSFFGGRVESDPESGSLGALDLGEVSVPFGSTERLYRHFDFRGNVSFVSDSSGEVVNHYRYRPYGVDAILGSGGNEVTFVGRSEIGPFMLLGARMYDPLIGRFLSPDPVFGLLNQYGYTLGNPVWFSDPDGRESGGILEGLSGGDVETIMEVVAAALAIAVGLVPAAGPQVAVALGVLVLILLVAEAVSTGATASAPPSGPARAFSGSLSTRSTSSLPGAGVAAPAGAVALTCAPVALSSEGRPHWIPGSILVLQVLLGMIILRQRRPRLGGKRC